MGGMVRRRTSQHGDGKEGTNFVCVDCFDSGRVHMVVPWDPRCPCGGSRERMSGRDAAFRLAQPAAEALADAIQRRSQEHLPVSVTAETAAILLGAGRTTVFRLLREGLLKRGRSVGRETRITTASIDALLEGPKKAARSPPPKTPQVAPPTSQELDEQRRKLFGAEGRTHRAAAGKRGVG